MILLKDREVLYAHMPHEGYIAEIGVYRGDNAEQILRVCAPQELHLVDPWEQQSGVYEKDPTNDYDLASMYEDVCRRFEGVVGVNILRMYSEQAAEVFSDGFFNWVYIDANHTLDAVRADLRLWWPKVRAGGFLCGHDYMVKDLKPYIEVKAAVDEFCAEMGVVLYALTEEKYGSWAIRK